jgi:rare lipoprotein A
MPMSSVAQPASLGQATVYPDAMIGTKMANGDTYNPNLLTIAHRSLPLNTRVQLIDPRKQKAVEAVVTDRMNAAETQDIRLSQAVATQFNLAQGQSIQLFALNLGTIARPLSSQSVPAPVALLTSRSSEAVSSLLISPTTNTRIPEQVKSFVSDVSTNSASGTVPASSFANGGTYLEKGVAAYYADKLNGNKTSSGTIFDNNLYTGAHRTLKFGTQVRVVNPRNGKEVLVTITDRGPHDPKLLIDITRRAAEAIDLVRLGKAEVELYVMDGNATTSSNSLSSANSAVSSTWTNESAVNNSLSQPVASVTRIGRPASPMPVPNQPHTWDNPQSGVVQPQGNQYQGIQTKAFHAPTSASSSFVANSNNSEANFTIQIGAFGSASIADVEIAKLPNSWREPIEGRNLYRVCAGKYATDDQANAALAQIKRKYPRAFIRQLF